METQQALDRYFKKFLLFQANVGMEGRSVEEEKQLFFNETGVEEHWLKGIICTFESFVFRESRASTDEERQSIEEARSQFFKVFEEFRTEKKKNLKSIPPAA